ncbi:MAG TPA: hypothetical protein V6C63_12215 [Allocoleopsis sp.]
MNPFQNFEEWRLQALSETLDILYCVQQGQFENSQDFTTRLRNTADQLDQLHANPPLTAQAYEQLAEF